MSRPRPPLHDPYGLLRPPPPLETSTSFYSATSNNLSSTVSLPLTANSPGRRVRQRGISPSRTQQGEEYDDQPYLTNVVRHHGQVTLVPPVNQGRTRKVRRRRNLEASTSTVSLVEPETRPISSDGPARPQDDASPHRSPRRPRQGSNARAISSPDVHSPSYPDYPPPSFEEVLALDRNPVFSGIPAQSPEQQVEPQSAPFAPPPPSSSNHLPSFPETSYANAETTPWEEDRRLGLSLEERVQRELERNLKVSSPTPAVQAAGNLFPDDAPSIPGSSTPTSVTASNFLTPQNLTPSPLGIPLPLSTASSPISHTSHIRSPTPPFVSSKPPVIPLPPTLGPSHSNRSRKPTLPHAVPVTESLAQTSSSQIHTSSADKSPHEEPAAVSRQTVSQGSPIKTDNPLTSLLFTTKLKLDVPPDLTSPVAEEVESTLVRGGAGDISARSSIKGKEKEVTKETSQSTTVTTGQADPPRAGSPRKAAYRSRLLDEFPATSGSNSTDNPSYALRVRAPVTPPSPPPVVVSPSKENLQTELPLLVSPNSTSRLPGASVSTLRRPPPPPPPRPRSLQVGAGVVARISAYEAILNNAPKAPPPIPPRPRERRPTAPSVPERNTVQENRGATLSDEIKRPEANIEEAHTIKTPRPRPTSLFISEPGPSQGRPLTGSRPLPAPPIPTRSPSSERTRTSPEDTKLQGIQPQALVPARIGPDGKLEIIPGAEVIWLDETKEKERESAEASATPRGQSYSRTLPQEHNDADPGVSAVGPSMQHIPSPPQDLPPPAVVESSIARIVSENDVSNPLLVSTHSNPFASPALPAIEPPATVPSSISPSHLADDFEYTDLDLLISRLEENETARQGANYEQLLAVGEVLGPGAPRPRPELDLNIGLVEIQRRRVTKDGRVKLKLSLMGIGVDKCGICLAQFKNNENAVLLACLHSFHTNCITSWLIRQDVPACPHCRTPV